MCTREMSEIRETIEKVKQGRKISRDEFRKATSEIDWSDYARSVVSSMCTVADAHEHAQARSLERARHRMVS